MFTEYFFKVLRKPRSCEDLDCSSSEEDSSSSVLSSRTRNLGIFKNWEIEMSRYGARYRRTIHYSSPNLASTTKYDDSDEEFDDYGFLKVHHRKPIQPPPNIPPYPREYQQQLLQEQQRKKHYENIHQKLYEFYQHHHDKSRVDSGGITNSTSAIATRTKANPNKQLTSNLQTTYRRPTQRIQSVPLQTPYGSDENWITGTSASEYNHISSGDTNTRNTNNSKISGFIDFVDDTDKDTEEEAEEFLRSVEKQLEEEETEKDLKPFSSNLCVKCLVRFFNNQASNCQSPVCRSAMSRVSDLFFKLIFLVVYWGLEGI